MNMLIPTPEPTGPSDQTLLILDVDGVVNRINDDNIDVGPKTVLVRTGHGEKFPINFEPEIIEALDTVIRDHGIAVGWATTWGPNVEGLLAQAFDGQLAGGFVLVKRPDLYRKKRPAHWKLDGIKARVKITEQPFVWVDDDAIDMATYRPDFDGGRLIGDRGLLIPTRPVLGLTMAEVSSIGGFAAHHNEVAGR